MRTGRVIGLMLLVAGIVTAFVGAHGLLEQSTAIAAYERLAHEALVTGDDSTKTDAIDWDALLSANPDIVAWCCVEGTSIKLPVCRARDEDPEFWLSHDLWGNDSPAGTLYVDHRANAQSQHVLCYGHHLAGTGGMFSELYRCHEQEEFDRVLTGALLWSTPDGKTVRLRPLCASVVDKNDADIQRFSFDSEIELRYWLQAISRRSTANNTVPKLLVAGATRAVTLVTCSSEVGGRRERTVITFAA